MCSLVMISTWTGAWGLMSWMATVRSPVRTMVASMSPETIEQKRHPGMAEPYRGAGTGGRLLVGVDPACRLTEVAALTSRAQGDDLGHDRHRRLFGGTGADVEAEGGVDALHLLVGDADLPQVLLALLVRAAAA